MRQLAICALALAMIQFGAQAAEQPSTSTLDNEIQLLRADLRTVKKDLVAKNMELTAEEAKAFWPIFDQYQKEVSQLWSERIAIIEQYGKAYPNVSEVQANEMAEKSLDLDQKLTKLRKTYYRKFKAAVSAKTAARFVQVDRRLNSLAELQIAQDIPLLK